MNRHDNNDKSQESGKMSGEHLVTRPVRPALCEAPAALGAASLCLAAPWRCRKAKDLATSCRSLAGTGERSFSRAGSNRELFTPSL